MTPQFWLVLCITLIGWIGTGIVFFRKQEKDNMSAKAEMDKELSLLREKIDRHEKEFRDHEVMNERQFEKYHQEMRQDMDKVFKAIEELRNLVFNLALGGKIQKNE
jgi:hypothetical protein